MIAHNVEGSERQGRRLLVLIHLRGGLGQQLLAMFDSGRWLLWCTRLLLGRCGDARRTACSRTGATRLDFGAVCRLAELFKTDLSAVMVMTIDISHCYVHVLAGLSLVMFWKLRPAARCWRLSIDVNRTLAGPRPH
jgi:hypothetical protein